MADPTDRSAGVTPLPDFERRLITTRAKSALALGTLLALYTLMVFAVGSRGKNWASLDQERFHLPQINFFVDHFWSWVDYPATSATTPGFHIFVAMIAHLAGLDQVVDGTWPQAAIPWFMGLAILAVLWWSFFLLARAPWRAALYCLPIASSSYFLLPSLYLVTDNTGSLGYALVLMGYLHYPTEAAALGITAALWVFARQIYLPVVVAYPMALTGQIIPRALSRPVIIKIVLAILPPVAVVVVYAIAWRGLVPPNFAHNHAHALSTVNVSAYVEALGLLGIFSVPYALLLYPSVHVLGRQRITKTMFICGMLALLLWAIVPSTANIELGRWGSAVWVAARLSPVLGEHALLVLPLLVLGACAIGLMIELARFRHYLPIELIIFLLYIAALGMQNLAFQRYTEIPILMTLSTTAARLETPRRWSMLAFLAIFGVYLAIAVMRAAGIVGDLWSRT
jgi:hypothetical protein